MQEFGMCLHLKRCFDKGYPTRISCCAELNQVAISLGEHGIAVVELGGDEVDVTFLDFDAGFGMLGFSPANGVILL